MDKKDIQKNEEFLERTIQVDFESLVQEVQEEKNVDIRSLGEEGSEPDVDFEKLLEKHSCANKKEEVQQENVEEQKVSPTATRKWEKKHGSKDLIPRNTEELYDIKDVIGQGGMGKIYCIYDKLLYRNLAMKVLIPKDIQQSQLDDFVEEARITSQLEHPNIIPVHDIGCFPDGNIYFTMKLVEGVELIDVLKGVYEKRPDYLKKYSLHNIVLIFRKICEGIAFAHSKGIVHRDLKPANIMIGNFGEVMIMDWGIARFADHIDDPYGTLCGTPQYMAPEQVMGEIDKIDFRTDIYLLGATLYHMITFTPPHLGAGLIPVLKSSQNGSFPPPHQRNSSQAIPLELSDIVMKCMALEREDRYQNVPELIESIDRFLSGDIVTNTKIFQAGEFIITQGEEGKEAYSIVNGNAEIFQNINGRNVLLTTMQAGSIVGEMGLISAAKRSAHVIAKEETEVVIIDEKLFQQALNKLPPWMEKIIRTLVSRLQTANKNVHPLNISDPVYHILNQLGMLTYFMALNSRIPIEQQVVNIASMERQVASNISITPEQVRGIISKMLTTSICVKKDEENFSFTNFPLFCHVLEFVRGVLEIDTTIKWHGQLAPLAEEQNKIKFNAAAILCPQAKEFIMNIPMYAKFLE